MNHKVYTIITGKFVTVTVALEQYDIGQKSKSHSNEWMNEWMNDNFI